MHKTLYTQAVLDLLDNDDQVRDYLSSARTLDLFKLRLITVLSSDYLVDYPGLELNQLDYLALFNAVLSPVTVTTHRSVAV